MGWATKCDEQGDLSEMSTHNPANVRETGGNRMEDSNAEISQDFVPCFDLLCCLLLPFHPSRQESAAGFNHIGCSPIQD